MVKISGNSWRRFWLVFLVLGPGWVSSARIGRWPTAGGWTVATLLTIACCILSVTSASFAKMCAYTMDRLVAAILTDKL